MKIPKPRQLKCGTWFLQLRLGGESISVKSQSRADCIQQAQLIKAEYLAGKRTCAEQADITLTGAIDRLIDERRNTVSPLTIRGYRIIQNHRFKDTMPRRLSDIQTQEWQAIINRESTLCSPKTLKNAWGLIKEVLRKNNREIPVVHLPSIPPSSVAFLRPAEIRVLIASISGTRYDIPLLLCLSSMRISEVQALKWENIAKDPEFIHISGSVVLDESNKWVNKKATKNRTSTRNVPILIPELKAAIERNRKPSGPVMEMSQNALRVALHKICIANGITDVTLHGLRHSFASLAYSLQIPEQIVMEIGGWADIQTMRKIYTHIAKEDISRYQNKLAEFYKNAN